MIIFVKIVHLNEPTAKFLSKVRLGVTCLMFLVVLWSFWTIRGHLRLITKVIFRSWSKCYGVVENGSASFYKDRKHENTNKEEFKFALSKFR